MAGLAVDLSRMTMTKASLQSIADHLALSGAREMQLRQRNLTALEAYLEARGRDHLAEQGLVADISALIDELEHSVRIVFEGCPETLFIKALRGETSVVSVEAVAMSVGADYPLCLVSLDESAQHSMHFQRRRSWSGRRQRNRQPPQSRLGGYARGAYRAHGTAHRQPGRAASDRSRP
ncbi:pilus assembly protein TadG-related protein [Saliniramus sp.]|uniref:pilus assembly protein TadG-related protein n=1 Tax=Saliniramus sp. TaxID=2986772 RepID=UPI0039C9B443